MKRICLFSQALLLILLGAFPIWVQAQNGDTAPPDLPVKLIFIHHSTGENWLTDDYGNLGRDLGANNYFVSDTNYGWGPNHIGDRTDIVNWPEWFRSSETPRYMEALYAESGKNSYYTRSFLDPGGENQIVMFKSCFPNSALAGSPNDPPDPNEGYTVGYAKHVYNDLLNYFSTRTDKLFVVITAPPLQDFTYSENARAFNDWLVYDWLVENNYALNNVAVFDFYNVLTHPDNHHRVNNGQIEHNSNGVNTLYYDSNGDDHPNIAGSQKATQEFIPLLNLYYHHWMAGEPVFLELPTDQPTSTKELPPTEEGQTPPETESQPIDQTPTPVPLAEIFPPVDLIDDFESNLTPKENGWSIYSDGSPSTQFTCTHENGSLRMDFDLPVDGWATCTLFFPDIRDWSQFEGIGFSYRSDAPGRIFDFSVRGGSLGASTSYLHTIESATGSEETWKTIDLAWNQILGVDWEEDARNPIDPAQITGISFDFSTFEGRSNIGTIWVDDLMLIEVVESKTATPEVPIPVEEEPTKESSTPSKATVESNIPPKVTEESPSKQGGGICSSPIALGLLVSFGVIRLRKKKRYF